MCTCYTFGIKGKGTFIDKVDKKPSKLEEKSKDKGKGKKIATMKKEGEKPTCSHCKKEGHDMLEATFRKEAKATWC